MVSSVEKQRFGLWHIGCHEFTIYLGKTIQSLLHTPQQLICITQHTVQQVASGMQTEELHRLKLSKRCCVHGAGSRRVPSESTLIRVPDPRCVMP